MTGETQHKPECMAPQTEWPCPQCAEISCECTCICERIIKAEKRLLDKIDFVLRNTPDELWIADNGNQAFNVKWWIIELIDEIGSKP